MTDLPLPFADRLLVALRAMIRAQAPAFALLGTFEYTITAQRQGPAAPDGQVTTLVDVVPVDPRTGLPPATNLPVRSSTWGESVSGVVVGQWCRVQFLDGSPAKPVVVSLSDPSQTVTVDASTSVTLGSPSTPLVPINGGGAPVALQQGLTTMLPPSVVTVTGLVNGNIPFTGTATGLPPGAAGIVTGGAGKTSA